MIPHLEERKIFMKTIGFIGTGLIGNPMARRLLTQGFHLKAHDQNPRSLQSVLDAGAEPVQGPGDLQDADAVLIVVNNMAQVNEVLLGEQGLIPAWKGGPMPIVVIMSTVSPEDVKGLSERLPPGQPRLLDAPISGGPILAEQGKLAVMVGGPEEEFAQVRPVFEALGERVYHMGPLGSGEAIKLVNNMIGLTSFMIVPEALGLGVQYGLTVDRMVEIVNASSGQTFVTENWPMFSIWLQAALQEDDPFGAREALFTTGRKDLETAKTWASSQAFATPILERIIDGLVSIDQTFLLERIRKILEQGKSP
jgi:3-hydroxyisobutyrate dehydrogenase-like beta-hydroxyacid dehydrogenase